MAKTKTRKPTLAAGAVIGRGLVRRYAQRQQKTYAKDPAENDCSGYLIWQQLLDWLDAQPSRTTRPGGIGR